jgi:hypothetical protein
MSNSKREANGKVVEMVLKPVVPMHSDSQQFVRVAVWDATFTAITRVIPFRCVGDNTAAPVRIPANREEQL